MLTLAEGFTHFLNPSCYCKVAEYKVINEMKRSIEIIYEIFHSNCTYVIIDSLLLAPSE